VKIAIYQPRISYYVGGGEVYPMQTAIWLSQRGHDVTILTTRANFITESTYFKFNVKEYGLKVVYLDIPVSLKWIYDIKPGSDWKRWDLESLYVGKLALNYFNENSYELVAIHNYLDIMGIPQSQKSVSHLHGYPAEANYLHRLIAGMASNYISVSSFIKEKWKDMLSLSNVMVSRNAINTENFKPKKIGKTIDVFYVGRLIPIKGVEYLLQALRYVDGGKLKVVIGGNGPEANRLEKMARKLDTPHLIEFVGHIPDEELVDFYNSSKIVVLPSYDREGVMTTMLEASACGVPVITTTAASMKEFIENEENGILVDPKNSEQLAEWISRLLADSALREKLGENARKSVLNEWDWARRISELEKFYGEIIHSN
jgi:glycosyltransferase involved in cell wall biosynthesis